MVLSQDYSEWMRMLHACAEASNAVMCHAFGWSDWKSNPESVLNVIQKCEVAPGLDTDPIQRVATALGIFKRHSFTWDHNRLQVCGRPLSYAISNNRIIARCWKTVNQTWVVEDTRIKVTGHPTRDSAIEHFERLYGRPEHEKYTELTYEFVPNHESR